MPANKVTITPVDRDQPEPEVPLHRRQGWLYSFGDEVYILAQTAGQSFWLVSLTDGNRFSDHLGDPFGAQGDNFKRLPPGRVVTVEVGDEWRR